MWPYVYPTPDDGYRGIEPTKVVLCLWSEVKGLSKTRHVPSTRYFYIFNKTFFMYRYKNKMCFCTQGLSWSWSYDSWIYNYLCNQCLLSLKLFEACSWRDVLETTLCDQVCQWQVCGYLWRDVLDTTLCDQVCQWQVGGFLWRDVPYTTLCDQVCQWQVGGFLWRDVLYTTLCDQVCQWQVGGFLRVSRFPTPIELTLTIELKICWRWRKTP